MIVIDSANKHGDSWTAAFYPQQTSVTFVREN